MDEKTVATDLRKEVFDYLRQLQKRGEQSTKVSGMNNWVLIAAMCYLAAWLLDHSIALTSNNTILVGLAVGLCIFFLRLIISPRRMQFSTGDARLLQFVDEDTSLIGLNICIVGLTPTLPTFASYLLFGWSYPVILGAIMSVAFAVAYIIGPIFKKLITKRYFRSIAKENSWTNFLGPLLTLAGLVLHTKLLFFLARDLPREQLIFTAHVTALWWVSWQLLHTVNSTAKINEYAHLEEMLMFGVATPTEILRELELKTFGPSLEKELKCLEDDIVLAHKKYVTALHTFNKAIVEIKEIPTEYKHEKEIRIKDAFVPYDKTIHEFMDSIEAKADYIASFLINKSSIDPTVRELLIRESRLLKDRIPILKSESRTLKHEMGELITTELKPPLPL